MIITALIIFGKFVLATLLLLAFHSGVLRSRAPYRMQRLYLLMIPFVSIAMSGLSFEVYKPEARIIEMDRSEAMQYHDDNRTTGYIIIADEGRNLEGLDINPFDDLFAAIQRVAEELTIIGVIICGLFAVSLILLLIAAYSIIRMCILRRRMAVDMTDDGYRLVCSDSIKVPFSFADTIFLPEGMEHEKTGYVLMHEKAHIAHRHYIDVWIIEFMTRLLWFNPLIWSVRKQLRNVHEYEADRCVIDAGVDMLRYQTFLLEEVAEDSMVIANGFNHSFIRRRFIEMKSRSERTLGKPGKVGTAVWVLLLFCLFTFTIGEADTIVKYVDKEASQQDPGEPTRQEELVSEANSVEGQVEEAVEEASYAIWTDDHEPAFVYFSHHVGRNFHFISFEDFKKRGLDEKERITTYEKRTGIVTFPDNNNRNK